MIRSVLFKAALLLTLLVSLAGIAYSDTPDCNDQRGTTCENRCGSSSCAGFSADCEGHENWSGQSFCYACTTGDTGNDCVIDPVGRKCAVAKACVSPTPPAVNGVNKPCETGTATSFKYTTGATMVRDCTVKPKPTATATATFDGVFNQTNTATE